VELALAMTGPTSAPTLPTWISVSLSIVFLIAGLIVLGDVVAATTISAVVIGGLAVRWSHFDRRFPDDRCRHPSQARRVENEEICSSQPRRRLARRLQY
jgi:hypothetical protein